MKKRLLSILLAVVLVLSLLPVISVFAASYDLIICGIEVTDANKDNILGDGKFSYNPTANKLTVKGSYNGNGIIIENRIDGLTIETYGSDQCSLTSYDDDVIDCYNTDTTIAYANLSLMSYGSSTNDSAIYFGAPSDGPVKTLTIKDSKIYANADMTICGGNKSALKVVNSEITVASTAEGISGFEHGFTLEKCYLSKPDGGQIVDGAVMEADGFTVAKYPLIKRGTPYDLWIDGFRVDSVNCSNVLGDGRFSYDDTYKTLTVKKGPAGPEQYSFSSNVPVILNRIDGLTVTTDPYDDNQITLQSNAEAVIESINADLNINGANLKLIVKNNNNACVYMDATSVKKTLSIEYSDLVLKGDYGLAGETTAALLINESTVDADNNKGGVCSFYKGIQLQNCAISVPEKGYIDSSSGEIRDEATHDLALHVLIEPTYGFKVGGKEVTKGNASDILGDGAFSYDDDSRTLTIKGSYKGSVPAVNNLWVSNLHINIANDVTLENTSGNDPVLRLRRHTILEGSGKLTLKADSGFGIYAFNEEAEYKTRVILKNVDLTVNAKYGIYAGNSGKPTLEITESEVKVNATEEGIVGFTEITLTSCGILNPAGGKIENGAIVKADGSKALNVVIGLGSSSLYDLWIKNEQVSDFNKDALAGGAAVYDPATKTLTVKGDIKTGAGPAIRSAIDGLTVKMDKDAVLASEVDGTALRFEASATITGSGKLSTAQCNTAIDVTAGTLTIDNANINAAGGYLGIIGNTTADLVIKNSTVSASGGNQAIGSFKSITLDNCRIETPADGKVEGGNIVSGGATAKSVVIVPGTPAPVTEYDLCVDHEWVTSKNASDILGNGVFAFDEASKTLTISGDYSFHTTVHDHGANHGIISKIDGLTIKVAKDSTLSNAYVVFSVNGNTTVTGPGKLTMPSTTCDFNVNGLGTPITLTIQNASLVLDSQILGNKDESLVIKNSNILPGQYAASKVLGFKSIELIGCELVKPAGAKIVDGTIKVGDDIAEGIEIKATGAQVNPFVDVKESDYFYDAVLWAYYHTPQVTNGLDATHFGPHATCTRGQIVTFLWRALGEPAPTLTVNPFVDVKESDYYYKAVLWAVEKGVTKGTDATHFAPNAYCKREHAVAFLYRAAGEPSYTMTSNPFVDVKSGAYYYDAVLWAVEKNITKGMDETHFGPENSCERSQIVTFLYRFMNP